MEMAELQEKMLEATEKAEQYDDPTGMVFYLLRQSLFLSKAPAGWRYSSYEDLVIDLAPMPRVEQAMLPQGYDAMEQRQCFKNAWELVQGDTDLLYCEGWALTNLFPVPHAWVEEPDGTIVDPTWVFDDVKEATYFGVRFRADVAIALSIESGWASVFGGDSAALGNRALRYGFETNDEGIVIGAIREEKR